MISFHSEDRMLHFTAARKPTSPEAGGIPLLPLVTRHPVTPKSPHPSAVRVLTQDPISHAESRAVSI